MFRKTSISSLIVLLTIITTLGLVSCSGSGNTSGSNKATDVTVTLNEYSITSSVTTFKVGVPYHFVVTNSGTTAHEFQIMPPAQGALTADQVKQQTLAGITQDKLPAGGSATLDYTFTKAYAAGSLEFACHLPGHYEGGMKLSIEVTQ